MFKIGTLILFTNKIFAWVRDFNIMNMCHIQLQLP